MSDPYVYIPPQSTYNSAYLSTGYMPPQTSPFIPTTPLPGGSSPYQSPYQSPYHNSIPLPDETTSSVVFPGGYEVEEAFYPTVARPRRLSWHAPADNTYLSTGDSYFRPRRRSFGNADGYFIDNSYPYSWAGDPYTGFAPSSPYFTSIRTTLPPTPGRIQLHPWLNGDNWRGDFLFDLSSYYFKPIQAISPARRLDGALVPRETRLAPMELLLQQATFPGMTRLRIVCDLIPQWPITISPDSSEAVGGYASSPGVQPISFLDVLLSIHRELHTRITHAEWRRLNSLEKQAVTRAYTRRCNALAYAPRFATYGVYGGGGVVTPASYGPELEQQELAQGVKRVDFLLRKVWFRGVVLDVSEGVLKMIVR